MLDHGNDGDDFSLETPADLVEGADMGLDFMERGTAKSFVLGQSGTEKVLPTGNKANGDEIIGLAGEDEADAVSEQHKIVDGIGYFEHFDFTAPLAGSPVLVEFGDVKFKTIPEVVHKLDGVLFQHMARVEVVFDVNHTGFIHIDLFHRQIFNPLGGEVYVGQTFLHTLIIT